MIADSMGSPERSPTAPLPGLNVGNGQGRGAGNDAQSLAPANREADAAQARSFSQALQQANHRNTQASNNTEKRPDDKARPSGEHPTEESTGTRADESNHASGHKRATERRDAADRRDAAERKDATDRKDPSVQAGRSGAQSAEDAAVSGESSASTDVTDTIDATETSKTATAVLITGAATDAARDTATIVHPATLTLAILNGCAAPATTAGAASAGAKSPADSTTAAAPATVVNDTGANAAVRPGVEGIDGEHAGKAHGPARSAAKAGASENNPAGNASLAAPGGQSPETSRLQTGAEHPALDAPTGAGAPAALDRLIASLPVAGNSPFGLPFAQPAAGVHGIAAASAAAAPTAPGQYEVATPVQHPAFGQDLTDQIGVLTAGGIERAEITVTPRELGPVRIELSLSGDDMKLVFTAAAPETRQAIEQSAPLLRAMLADQGITLGRFDVGGGAQRGDRQDASANGGHAAQAGSGDANQPGAGDRPAPATTLNVRRGLLDLFA